MEAYFGNVLGFSTLQLWVAYFMYIKSWKYNSNKHVRKPLVVWRVWEVAESWLVYKNKFLGIIQSYFLTGTIKKKLVTASSSDFQSLHEKEKQRSPYKIAKYYR